MIPELVEIGSLWPVLPPGVHDATIEEVEAKFSRPGRRESLFSGFRDGATALRNAGCHTVLLDGSFVTGKPIPGDFDACWDPSGVEDTKLDPVLLDFSEGRKRQKERFGGEFFPATCLADGVHFFTNFFQIDKYTGKAKGIIRICFP